MRKNATTQMKTSTNRFPTYDYLYFDDFIFFSLTYISFLRYFLFFGEFFNGHKRAADDRLLSKYELHLNFEFIHSISAVNIITRCGVIALGVVSISRV